MAEEEVKGPAPELEKAEIPWVVAYLREDIQDLRNEVREVRRSVQRLDESVDARIGELRQEMGELRQEIGELRREMAVQLRRIIGIVIGAMLAMTGVFAWIVDRTMPP